ncbi:formylglycine-generating enzyme family protein [Aquibium carbonis]|uniref:Formylglycine-generating enzyme family protein n=1 Tax=Aquibium carbonis TaxID=2495581 RepID=A0A3R9YQN7_9HYPH|nr:SUMF1/EgtB/PvdO family nonheme iron enzyme [Aquibium carbonis]RST84751.1 formylglycine-generating enzyme family protein [Aquibium carbonis]
MPWHVAETAAGGVVAVALSIAALAAHGSDRDTGAVAAPPTVVIEATRLAFPEPGEFLVEGRAIPAPVRDVEIPAFAIMTHQVGLADYGRCVAAGRCMAADTQARAAAADVPVTGVSYFDALAYAAWLGEATGATWRLPSALEAAAAAGERFSAETFSDAADDPKNPAVAWIRRYREQAASVRAPEPAARPFGSYGVNSLGVADFGGNVWEWTSTCYVRVGFEADRVTERSRTENCRVHVLEGRHRAIMSDFVRDGRSGGCAVGTPPDNLGFRLVQEPDRPGLVGRILGRIAAVLDR